MPLKTHRFNGRVEVIEPYTLPQPNASGWLKLTRIRASFRGPNAEEDAELFMAAIQEKEHMNIKPSGE